MQTTLMVNDKVYIKTNITHIERGKIYTFIKDGSYMIKRCIGVEGDHIKINDNDVYLNQSSIEAYCFFDQITVQTTQMR